MTSESLWCWREWKADAIFPHLVKVKRQWWRPGRRVAQLETSRAQELLITPALYTRKFMSLGHSQSNINWGFYSFIVSFTFHPSKYCIPTSLSDTDFSIWLMFFEHLCFKFSNYPIKHGSSLFGIKKATANDWIVVTKYAFKFLIFLLS